jgi:Pyruvate/2-oxoacid:ferredoxin oxidoreductase delta subunit
VTRRKIIRIDDEKCDGCGLCVPSCAEGAIQIIGGKARMVSDTYCDGLGACLGECPQGAISIVEREAEAFDEEAARQHAAGLHPKPAAAESAARVCPGAAPMDLSLPVLPSQEDRHSCLSQTGEENDSRLSESEPSALGNWPVQLHLIPPDAPFLKNADVLLVADCVPFALPDFHRRFLRGAGEGDRHLLPERPEGCFAQKVPVTFSGCGRPVVIGCPKLDNAPAYVQKLAQMLDVSAIRSLTVVHMEVPCCTGLVRIAEAAVRATRRDIPIDDVTISIRGKVLPGVP